MRIIIATGAVAGEVTAKEFGTSGQSMLIFDIYEQVYKGPNVQKETVYTSCGYVIKSEKVETWKKMMVKGTHITVQGEADVWVNKDNKGKIKIKVSSLTLQGSSAFQQAEKKPVNDTPVNNETNDTPF